MAVNLLIVAEFIVLFIFTAFLLRYYASRSTHWVYLIAVGISWYLGFCGTLLLPIDVETTLEEGPQDGVKELWYFTYWVTFIMSWVVLPLMMEYYASGQFTSKGRMKDSLKANLKFYAAIMLLGIVFMIWMAISKSWGPSQVASFLSTASNTYGMLLIVVMMGYGLVEAPRSLWIKADPRRALTRLEFKAVGLEEDLFDAKAAVDECCNEARNFSRQIPLSTSDPDMVHLRECLDVVIGRLLSDTYRIAGEERTDKKLTLANVAALHTRLIAAIPKLERCEAAWDALVVDASELQAMIEGGEQPTDYDSAHPETRLQRLFRRFRWLYKSKLSWWGNKVSAVLLAVMSSLVLWCELAVPLPGDLSLFGLLVHGTSGAFGKQLLAFLPFVYMSTCMYLALFRIKFFSVLTLTAGRLTNAYSLMYNASYLCRLQFVLAFNYLLLLKTESSRRTPTAFEQSVGAHMAFFGTDFNNLIPVLLLVFAVLTLFRVLDRCVRKIGVEGFGSYVQGNLEHEEKVREGRQFIKRARDRTMRMAPSSRSAGAGDSGAADNPLARAHARAQAIRGQMYTPPPATSATSTESGWAGLGV